MADKTKRARMGAGRYVSYDVPYDVLRFIALYVPYTLRGVSQDFCRWVKTPTLTVVRERVQFLRAMCIRPTTTSLRHYYTHLTPMTVPRPRPQMYRSRCMGVTEAGVRCQKHGIWKRWRMCWAHRNNEIPVIAPPSYTSFTTYTTYTFEYNIQHTIQGAVKCQL